MNKNFEIKCKCDDRKLKAVSGLLRNYKHCFEKQIDIYYKVKSGRLKLRIINDRVGNLIFYDRKEQTGKRISNYIISKTSDFREADLILRKQFDVLVKVSKHRNIYINKNIRVHIDTVKGLGRFLEIEIIYEKDSNPKKQMEELITQLGLGKYELIKKSYSDLLINRN